MAAQRGQPVADLAQRRPGGLADDRGHGPQHGIALAIGVGAPPAAAAQHHGVRH